MDITDPEPSLELCVSQCPEEPLLTNAKVQEFAEETGSQLCRYDIEPVDYPSTDQSIDGPCPVTIFYGRYAIFSSWIDIGYGWTIIIE